MKKYILLLFLLTYQNLAFSEYSAEQGQVKSMVCIACHGPNGNSAIPTFPKLAGQHATYFTKQMNDFLSGARVDPVMKMQLDILKLSKQDIGNIALFYAQQKPSVGTIDPKLAQRGKQIYLGGDNQKSITACSACHGPKGAGISSANYPQISGQHAGYTVKQLQSFRAGSRANDANMMMRTVVSKMTDDDIMAVASYIQGLKQ